MDNLTISSLKEENNTVQLKKKKAYNGILDSVDSTGGLDNNCAIMQHNKGRIAVKSGEEEDIYEEDT